MTCVLVSTVGGDGPEHGDDVRPQDLATASAPGRDQDDHQVMVLTGATHVQSNYTPT